MKSFSFMQSAVLLLFLVLIFSAIASACPVCYGETESKMADGVNAAIMVLLGITGGVLTLFTSLFLRFRKRIKMTLSGSVDYPSSN
ncbi:MAG: hypothetical protein HY088_03000 [Ignavibacteriales bacterium]|nr:hypothetical protein [Ignavibacteriales bacterium]